MNSNISIALEAYPDYAPTMIDDQQAFIYPRGARITGTVSIDATQMIKARAVELGLQWQTSGKGDTNRGEASPLIIHQGGELTGFLTIPFEIDAPLAPLSYHGTLIKINWFLRVRIDRPWALDMKLDVPIVIV